MLPPLVYAFLTSFSPLLDFPILKANLTLNLTSLPNRDVRKSTFTPKVDPFQPAGSSLRTRHLLPGSLRATTSDRQDLQTLLLAHPPRQAEREQTTSGLSATCYSFRRRFLQDTRARRQQCLLGPLLRLEFGLSRSRATADAGGRHVGGLPRFSLTWLLISAVAGEEHCRTAITTNASETSCDEIAERDGE